MQPLQQLAIVRDDGGEFGRAVRRQRTGFQHRGKADDRRQRAAHFMADMSQKLRLEARGAHRAFVLFLELYLPPQLS